MRFTDAVNTLNQPSAWRYLDMIYWGVIHKTKLITDAFTGAYALTSEDFHTEFHHELEEQFQMTFDFHDYHAPSHYSEIFLDWKEYEEAVRHVLGPIDGLG